MERTQMPDLLQAEICRSQHELPLGCLWVKTHRSPDGGRGNHQVIGHCNNPHICRHQRRVGHRNASADVRQMEPRRETPAPPVAIHLKGKVRSKPRMIFPPVNGWLPRLPTCSGGRAIMRLVWPRSLPRLGFPRDRSITISPTGRLDWRWLPPTGRRHS